ncbi:MAG: AAA family ATPase, partial [Atopobiaceae bacterium]|nr:AAA family ATPase [Atopobiaceae bacterium]
MRRKVSDALRAWKDSPTRKPLVLNGARQTGKTYSVLEFGHDSFAQMLHIDFSARRDLCALFDGDITPETLLPQLEAACRMSIDPQTTLIFFDEVQACPRALTSLKYFCERTPEYHVIAAGSLLGVALGRRNYSYPVGKVDVLAMHPL